MQPSIDQQRLSSTRQPLAPAPDKSRAARLVIADAHPIIRCGLRSMLDERKDWCIVGEAVEIDDLAQLIVETRPDVVIVDPSSLTGDPGSVIRQTRALFPDTEILVFTSQENEVRVRDWIAAGARGCILKTDAREHILAAIDALLDHRPYLTWQISETLLNSLNEPSYEQPGPIARALTRRETEIVTLIADGLSNRRIAEQLAVSIKTIEAHRTTAMRKIRANSTADVVRYALRHRLVEA